MPYTLYMANNSNPSDTVKQNLLNQFYHLFPGANIQINATAGIITIDDTYSILAAARSPTIVDGNENNRFINTTTFGVYVKKGLWILYDTLTNVRTTIDSAYTYVANASSVGTSSQIYTSINTNATLAINSYNLVDTTAARTLTLPALATGNYGQAINIIDITRNAATNNITITSTGSDTITGVSGSLIIDINGSNVTLVSSSSGWKLF